MQLLKNAAKVTTETGDLKNIYGTTCLDGYFTENWGFHPFFMSTLEITQPHLKSFSDFI